MASSPISPERRAAIEALVPRTLEQLLTCADYFGLTTATPLQRAICRVADGLPLGELATHEHVRAAIGEWVPGVRPAEVCVVSGIRTAKSMLAASGAVRMSQTCDVSRLGAGETPRVSVVSLKIDLAEVILTHLVGNLLAKPALRRLLVEEPTGDAILLRHPSGRPVEIKVVAGARAGASLVARWSAGAIFDEAPRMVGAAEGVVNLDDMRAAVVGRLLPGAAIWTIGSPWAPFGPVFRMVNEHWRRPSPRLVVVKAPAWQMNPTYWTEAKLAELARTDPTAYRTDAEAEFADPVQALIPLEAIRACERATAADLPPEPGCTYYAAMDPATRGNAWTLIVGTMRRGKRTIVLAKQWRGTVLAPLDPRVVLAEIAAAVAPYGITTIETDQLAADFVRVYARDAGITTVEWPATAATNTAMYLELQKRVEAREVELPALESLRADLQRLRKRVTQAGVSIDLPKTADGRHCDFAPAVARVLRRWMQDQAPPPPTPEEAAVADQRETFDRVRARHGAQRKKRWWDS